MAVGEREKGGKLSLTRWKAVGPVLAYIFIVLFTVRGLRRFRKLPADVYKPDFPGETFRVLKEKEQAKFGEYRTRRLVLDAWDKLLSK